MKTNHMTKTQSLGTRRKKKKKSISFSFREDKPPNILVLISTTPQPHSLSYSNLFDCIYLQKF